VAGHRFCLGVQWHPEESDDRRLFAALVGAARSTAR
jgi:putative glutamine amidotransferase